MTDDNTLGGRLRILRLERGLSQEELGEAAGISAQMVAKTERGTRTPRYPKLAALAEALTVPLSELTDATPAPGGVSAGILALRDVIQSPSAVSGLGQDEDCPPLAPADIDAETRAAAAAYWAGNMTALTAMMPALIRSARATRAASGVIAAAPLARAYERAALLLVHLGQETLAAASAGLAVTASAEGHDPALHAMTRGTYAWVLLHQGRMDEAERIAADAARDVEPAFSPQSGAEDEHRIRLATYGNLLLTALGPCAAAGRDGGEYLRAALAAAERIGRPVRLYGTNFSAASVHMQATYAYAVNREPGRALDAAAKVRLDDLPGTISRGRHLLDKAQAYVDGNDADRAVTVMREAQAMAPSWFRRQGVARQLTGELLVRQQRTSRMLKDLMAATEASGRAAYYRPGLALGSFRD